MSDATRDEPGVMRSGTGLPFESEGQRFAHERLGPAMERLFPGEVAERVHAIGFVVRSPAGVVTCTVAPRAPDTATIAVRSYLAGSVTMTAEVLRELARWTAARRFGVFGVDDADNVYFEEQLPAASATDEALAGAVASVRATVAERTPGFRGRFGGVDL